MKIILGSASKQRKGVLEKMGYVFEVMTAGIDEKAIREVDPKKLTMALAKAKAEALRSRIKEPALLITADQVVVCNGQILEKPENLEQARSFLRGYADYPAKPTNSILVTNTETGVQVGGSDENTIYLRPLPEDVIEQLIKEGNIFSWAGAYALIDPLIVPYIDRVEGSIDSAEGLPRELTERLLREAQEKN
ncbi:MAG: hypothetical protein A3J68_01590 [Candidatus Wildermuthbacteria bacterium RIFCSPHIGHO2_02_FULL_48_16]|uniref:Nucleoside triphosphate pyrophosphatase n=1 Tax=Candidatus Wildermuthbacteria bacterium RIFCSPHIGHO2_02_FULL_48_16 TaxID=1802453 RepID=A0A1G2R879_9BACT|nr:MAG: hypothetical protein A3J68_01590 [Candidatus Wildermuthbacteria bacterium RIFCSPHIGHO2_02_FULL_48_16]